MRKSNLKFPKIIKKFRFCHPEVFTALHLLLPTLFKIFKDRSCYELSINVYLNGICTYVGRIIGDNRSGANCYGDGYEEYL